MEWISASIEGRVLGYGLLTTRAQNGGYINPPAIKRQHRDPYGDWWDKQERRNFGEPVHEDNDLLAMFSPHEYTWTTPGKGAVLFLTFVATLLSGVGIAYYTYPDFKSYPRDFPDGLERELGGAGAVRVSSEYCTAFWYFLVSLCQANLDNSIQARKVGDPDP